MTRSRRRRARRNRKRRDALNADLFESSDEEERSARKVLTPESNWRELQFQAYLRDRMRRAKHKKTVQVIDEKDRAVSLAERIVRFKLVHSQEAKQMEPAVSLSEKDEGFKLQDLLQQYIQQRQSETALSSELLNEIDVVKASLHDDVMLSKPSPNGGRQSQSMISLGDSATDFNTKMRYREAVNHRVDKSGGRRGNVDIENNDAQSSSGFSIAEYANEVVNNTFVQNVAGGKKHPSAHNNEQETNLKNACGEACHSKDVLQDNGLKTYEVDVHGQFEDGRDRDHENEKAKEEEIPTCEDIIIDPRVSLENSENSKRYPAANQETGGKVSGECNEPVRKNYIPTSDGHHIDSKNDKDDSYHKDVAYEQTTHDMERIKPELTSGCCNAQEKDAEDISLPEKQKVFQKDPPREVDKTNVQERDETTSTRSHSDTIVARSKTFIISSDNEMSGIEWWENTSDSRISPLKELTECMKMTQNKTENNLSFGKSKIANASGVSAESSANVSDDAGDGKEGDLDPKTEPYNDAKNLHEITDSPIQRVFDLNDANIDFQHGQTMDSHPVMEGNECSDETNFNDLCNEKERHPDDDCSSADPVPPLPMLKSRERLDVNQNTTSISSKQSYIDVLGPKCFHAKSIPKKSHFYDSFEKTASLSCVKNSLVHLPLVNEDRNVIKRAYSKGGNGTMTSLRVGDLVGWKPLTHVQADHGHMGQRRIFRNHGNGLTNETPGVTSKHHMPKGNDERERRIDELYRKLKKLDVFEDERLGVSTSHVCSRYVDMRVEWGFIATPGSDRRTKYGKYRVNLPFAPPENGPSPFYDPSVFKEYSRSPPRNKNDFIYLRDVSFCRFVHSSVSESRTKDFLGPLQDAKQEKSRPFEKTKWQGRRRRINKGTMAFVQNTNQSIRHSSSIVPNQWKSTKYNKETDG